MAAYAYLVTEDDSAECPHLYSFEACPFAQTTRITLVHKGVKFRHTEIEIFNEAGMALVPRPDWFLEISPKGRVPVLQHRGKTLYESAFVDQYLDEAYPRRPLMPSDIFERAVARVWLHQASTVLPRLWYRSLIATPDDVEPASARLIELFAEFEEVLGQHGGDRPFLFGAEPTLADLFFAPFYERIQEVNAPAGRFDLGQLGHLPRVTAHIEACFAHPSYAATKLDPDMLRRQYRPFLDREDWVSPENNKATRDIVE